MKPTELDEIIDRWNHANDLLTDVLEQRLKTYRRDAILAIIESWRDVRTLIEDR